MPDKTTHTIEKIMKFREAIADVLSEVDSNGLNISVDSRIYIKDEISLKFSEALAQQQQEDYQEVLDLDIMQDEDLKELIKKHRLFGTPKAVADCIEMVVAAENNFKKELRIAIAEKRGKVW